MKMESAIERSATCPILVGRKLCMEILQARLDNAANGLGATIVVAAEAGVGKSRLVREAAKVARGARLESGAGAKDGDRGFLVLQGGCFETEQSLPFAPIIDLLRAFLLSSPPETAGSIIDAHAADLERILPEMAAHSPQAQPVTTVPSLGPQGDKYHLISTLTSIFAQLASAQPLMIVLEDLHWSDDISLEFLLHIARRVPQQRILQIATYRSDETRPALLHTLAELDRERLAVEIRLAPLSVEEVDAMLQAIFDLHRPVHHDFLNKIYELTEGNPFFVEEILKSLLSSGDIVYADIVRDRNSLMDALVPRTVQDAVQRRSRLLSAEARRMLALAAVLGRRFSFDLLLELLQINEDQLLSLIKESIRAQLITEESADHFAFRHALTRQAIYSELLARERKTLHGEIARKLEQSHKESYEGGRRTGGRRTEITEAGLAYHCFAAGMWRQAYDHACRAGEEAQALYAHSAAVDYFSMALDATRQLAAIPTPSLYRARGLSHNILGDFDAALADHTEALRLARQGGNSRDEWQSLLDLAALWSGKDYRETNRYSNLALDLARGGSRAGVEGPETARRAKDGEGRRGTEMGDPSTLAHTLNQVGNWRMNANMPDDARRFHEEALSIFEAIDERPGIAATLSLLGSAAMFSDDLVQGSHFLRRAIELYRDVDDQLGQVNDLTSLALCAPSLPTNMAVSAQITLQEAVRSSEEALRIAQETGWRASEAFARFALSVCHGTLGNYADAFTHAQTALDIAREIEHTEWMVAAQDTLGVLYGDILAFPQALTSLEESWSLAREVGSDHWLFEAGCDLALASIACGDLSRAEHVLNEILTTDTLFRSVGQRLCWSARAQLALAQSQPRLALDIIDGLFASTPNLPDGPTPLRLLKIHGEALAMLGHRKEAESTLLEAEATALAKGARPLQWRLNLSLGNLYRAQGNRSAAAGRYAITRGITEELAENIPNEALKRGFLREVSALLPQPRPLSAARVARETFGGLTAREREVAVLVSRGCTNRQIGDQLHITEETAAVHVKNILSKLNFTSRTQIAAWAAEHSL